MNSAVEWQESNNIFLSAALAWLRLKLERIAESGIRDSAIGISHVGRDQGAAGKDEVGEPVQPSLPVLAKLRRRLIYPADDRPFTGGSPLAESSSGDADLTETYMRMQEAEKTDPPPALLILSERLGLTRFESHCLLLCAAMDLDTRIPALCAGAQGDPNRPYPTFALLLSLFDDPAWDVLSPERPLRYWRLVEITQSSSQPLTTCPLRADERIVNYVKGLNYLDDRLTPLLVPFDSAREKGGLSPSQEGTVAQIASRLESGIPGHIVQLAGPDRVSKQIVASCVADAFNRQVLRLPAEVLPSNAPDLDALARLWTRENLLLPLALYLDAYEDPVLPQGQEPQSQLPLSRFLSRLEGLVFVDTREIRPDPGLGHLVFDIRKPTPPEQQQAWVTALSEGMKDAAGRLAGQFNLNIPEILAISREVAEETRDPGRRASRVWGLCVAVTRPKMERLAQRIEPCTTWDDLVLPDEQADLLHQISDQVANKAIVYDAWGFRERMNRGLGISALFSGESGTGKTMAAEVMAHELGLDLYRIDLSAVVSKYIGETEKNLRKLFDAAEDGGAILFFDEADAIFGKRSEVKDSHDRYANIEINYLLQRMESYNGLAILATNMKSALDQAFLRRIRFVVNFPFPSQADRKRIWQKVFPEATPVDGLNYDRLSRLTLTGGSILNIALGAAFLASKEGTKVTMPLVLSAVRTEYRKLEKPVGELDSG